MNSKSLVLRDGSGKSFRTLKHGSFLASKVKAKLVVLYVLHSVSITFILPQKVIDSVDETDGKESNEVFAKVNSKAQNYNRNTITAAFKGHKVVECPTIEHADQYNIGVVVIRSMGLGEVIIANLEISLYNAFHYTISLY